MAVTFLSASMMQGLTLSFMMIQDRQGHRNSKEIHEPAFAMHLAVHPNVRLKRREMLSQLHDERVLCRHCRKSFFSSLLQSMPAVGYGEPC